jgi:GNAT superfamily N-acetyltransferase
MELLEAGITDLEEASVLFDAYRQFYRYPPDLGACRSYLRERISRGESRVFLVRIDGRPAGFMQLYPSFSSLSMKPVWILYDLFVAPEARKLGVGTRLLARAHELAVETGASEVTLATAIDNKPAQQAYERMGWNRDEDFYYYNLVI